MGIDKGKRQSACKFCYNDDAKRQYKKEYYKKNKEKWKQGREEFFTMYGNECECCQESIKEFLTLEHKLGQIGIKKKDSSTRAYKKAIVEYRPDLYGVLCHNCNNTIGRLGYCPYHPERKAAYVPLHSG